MKPRINCNLNHAKHPNRHWARVHNRPENRRSRRNRAWVACFLGLAGWV
jgi:hypothetical protein